MRTTSVILIFFLSFTCVFAAKTKEKTTESTTQQPAIIAIEIVDPNENSTSSKNSKRTIESALGYGYNSYDTSRPRYEIYKYSQHDIPPYKGYSPNRFRHSSTIQKSVQYTLPTITEHVPSSLKPGTTLYSSLSSHGQLGGLKSSLADVSNVHSHDPVPVIVLRIYPDQLKDSTIQANLPDYHPFAKSINSINIQSLLEHYIKALKPAQGEQGLGAYKSNQQHYQQQQQYYQEPQYQQQQYDDYNSVQVQKAPAKYELSYQSSPAPSQYLPPQPSYQSSPAPPQPSYQSSPAPPQYQPPEPSYQSSPAPPQYQQQPQSQPEPEQQYYYITPNAQNSQEDSQYYHEQQQYYQDDQYYQPQYEEEPKLLTHENYPSDKHTRVLFRQNVAAESTEAPQKEVKTIQITVPDNVADVKVEQTERPYYGYQNQEQYYEPQDTVKQQYYAQPNDNQDAPFNYQNIDYEQMAKYLESRSVMPTYFYQSGGKANNEEMVQTYEDASFPSTTATVSKKTKGKKRT